MKLNLGSGDWKPAGYITYDLHDPSADVKGDAKKLPYPDNSIEEILASHLLEHFDYYEGFAVLKEWRRALKPGGRLIIEVPNLLEACRRFVEDHDYRIELYTHIFGQPWAPGQAHRFGYTPEQLRWTLEQVGFKNIAKVPTRRYKELGVLCMRMEATK